MARRPQPGTPESRLVRKCSIDQGSGGLLVFLGGGCERIKYIRAPAELPQVAMASADPHSRVLMIPLQRDAVVMLPFFLAPLERRLGDQPELAARMVGRDRVGEVVERTRRQSAQNRTGEAWTNIARGERLTITRCRLSRCRGCLSRSVSWLSDCRLNFVLATHEADTNRRCWSRRTASGQLAPTVSLLSAVERAHAVLDKPSHYR